MQVKTLARQVVRSRKAVARLERPAAGVKGDARLAVALLARTKCSMSAVNLHLTTVEA